MSIWSLGRWLFNTCLIVGAVHAEDLGKTYQAQWNELAKHPHEMKTFLEHLPKGADLHCHVSGAARTEAMLNLALSDKFCIDQAFNLSPMVNGKCQSGIATQIFFMDENHRKQAIAAWSMQSFHASADEDAKTHFFKTFPKFDVLAKRHWPELIANVANEASRQNIEYLELMMSMLEGKPKIEQLNLQVDEQQKAIAKTLKQAQVHQFVEKNIEFYSKLRQLVKQKTPLKSQDVGLAWILEIKRNQPFPQFWLDSIEVFEIANRVPDVVAINLVQPEYAQYANSDYLKQMEWLKTLRQRYPDVKVVLHAGEIPKSLARKNPVAHIHEALAIANPERIGHATSIEQEANHRSSIKMLKTRQVAVEVNLTSNDEILGVRGSAHPLHLFLMSNVPVVLSSDDPGISRHNLSYEYWRAVHEHELDLAQILQVDRNSLSYSLLPGPSIWKDNNHSIPVKACRDLHSKSCLAYIANSKKAYYQWQLEQRLSQYLQKNLGVKTV
jgi:adenosine deaminase